MSAEDNELVRSTYRRFIDSNWRFIHRNTKLLANMAFIFSQDTNDPTYVKLCRQIGNGLASSMNMWS